MNAGILGEANLNANSDTLLYTVPAGTVTTMTVSFCNRTNGEAKVTLLVPKVVGDLTTYFEDETPIPPKGVLERAGVVAQEGRNVMVKSDSDRVCAVVHGFEEVAV